MYFVAQWTVSSREAKFLPGIGLLRSGMKFSREFLFANFPAIRKN